MDQRVLVTGATGMLGTAMVAELRGRGFMVRAASRRPRDGDDWVVLDLTTGAGLADAVADVGAIVHLAAAPYRRGYTDRVEIDGTRRLLASAREAGVGHVLYTSILGADQVPWGYFGTKIRAEQLLSTGGVPWSIVRAAQFHAFVDRALRAMARAGVVLTDNAITAQPVDVRDVAAFLRARLEAGPSGAVEYFGGPEVLSARDVIGPWLRARGMRRPVLPLRVPGRLGKAFRSGALTTDATPTGSIAWRDYVSEKYQNVRR
ncbi:MAG TPA: NAD(P)H-binding protein [Kribbellaceae bacterium]|nr:NAD(P)H-binding protein [Kribbellaceae bacterium]